jgi:hypothetical protein
MSYYALLSWFFISVAFCTDVQSSDGGQLPTNHSNIMTLEDRLRLLEEALSANVVPESDSIEDRLAQMERALLVANSRVSQLISKLRRANYAFAKALVSEDKLGKTSLN